MNKQDGQSKKFRCGWCGALVNKDGENIEDIIDETYNNCEMMCGNCCIDEVSYNYERTITLDMAIVLETEALKNLFISFNNIHYILVCPTKKA